MEDLRAKGIDLRPKFERTSNSQKLKSEYQDKTKEELAEINAYVKIAGGL